MTILKLLNKSIQFNGLKTVEDYTLLYRNQWTASQPNGPAPGALTNYSQDLFFSMERLANSPFSVRRLPKTSKLPFKIDESIVSKVAQSSSTNYSKMDASSTQTTPRKHHLHGPRLTSSPPPATPTSTSTRNPDNSCLSPSGRTWARTSYTLQLIPHPTGCLPRSSSMSTTSSSHRRGTWLRHTRLSRLHGWQRFARSA